MLTSITLAAGLIACTDQEARQRETFIAFLQTDVLDHGPVSVPKLDPEEARGMGDYARHYTIITDFHDALNERVQKPMVSIMARGSASSITDIVQRRDELFKARKSLQGLHEAVEEELARADATRASLKQPDDLKSVYGKAYRKTVTIPGNTFKDIFPTIDETFGMTLDLADYIRGHGDQIRISGSFLEISDPAIQGEINTRIHDINAKAREMGEAQARLQQAIQGG
ncbi:MAG: DUF3053 family protein [Phyllobacterium sp.]